jgi:excisionase family DNA binding protein
METAELDLLTTEEVAELCRTSVGTVHRWAYMGTGPRYARVGVRRLYRRADVVAWLEAKWLASA